MTDVLETEEAITTMEQAWEAFLADEGLANDTMVIREDDLALIKRAFFGGASQVFDFLRAVKPAKTVQDVTASAFRVGALEDEITETLAELEEAKEDTELTTHTPS